MGPSKLVVTGLTANDAPFRQEVDVDLPPECTSGQGLMRLWARKHVDTLLERDERSSEALALSIEHHIVGPLTALVAEDSEVSVELVTLPVGWLVVTQGNDAGQRFCLVAERTIVGRAPLIAGAATAELDKQRIDEHVFDAWQHAAERLHETDEAERIRWLTAHLQERDVRPRDLVASESSDTAPMCFRPIETADVEDAMKRLRLAGRLAA